MTHRRPPRRRRPPPIDWRLTAKAREAAREGRIIIKAHARDKLDAIGLDEPDLLHVLQGGVVLPYRERDEEGTAIDGCKHFLSGVAPNRVILEVVFKFVLSEEEWKEELVVIITLYGGRL